MEVKLRKVEIPPIGMHLIIPVKINEVEVDFVLDTGASRSVVDIEFLNGIITDLELKKEESDSAGVGASDLASFTTSVRSFVVGNLIIKAFEIACLDLKHVKQSYENIDETPIYGVLGGDILNDYNAVIDYFKLTLWLND